MPPWNPIFGHLFFCYKIASALPADAHPNYLPDAIRRGNPSLGPIFYLDAWPFGPQMLVVASTRGLYQITQEHSLPKYPALKYFLQPIADGLDLVTMEGELWKKWRAVFNPGFSAQYLMNLTTGIMAETETFCGILHDLSRDGKRIHMKDLADNLTMDIIGRIVIYKIPVKHLALFADRVSQERTARLSKAQQFVGRWSTHASQMADFRA